MRDTRNFISGALAMSEAGLVFAAILALGTRQQGYVTLALFYVICTLVLSLARTNTREAKRYDI